MMMLHQWALFEYTSLELLGLIGTLFSCIYLTAAIIDLGLEASLAPFYQLWSSSRSAFCKFIAIQLIPNYCAGAILMVAAYWLHTSIGFTLPILVHLDTFVLSCVAITIFAESTRKTLKTILQIVFQNRIHTILEIGTLGCYVLFIWSAYLLGHPIDLPLLFGGLCAMSVIATVTTATWVTKWYLTLPSTPLTKTYSHTRLFKSRLFGYLHRMGTIIFSANFMVPLFAYEFGLEYAGLLRFICNITHNITSIVHKIFGASGNALLAHTRYRSHEEQQHLFGQLTHKLNQTLYALIIFFAINHRILLGMSKAPLDYLSIALFGLTFIMQLTESFALAFEKLFLVYERSETLFCVTFIATITTGGLVLFAPHCGPLTLLFIFASIRALSLVMLHLIALYAWKLRAHWQISTPYIIGSVVFSLIFFLAFR